MPAPLGRVSVIRHMHVSEKASLGQAHGQYVFIVTPRATKPEVAKEVTARYKVQVDSVKITKLPGKSRRLGRFSGRTSGIRKAVVVLKKGQTIASA